MRTAPLDVGGVRIRTYDLVVLAIAAVATVLLALFLPRTKRGAAMQAVAMDHEAATAVGIHVGRSNAIAFMIGAGLAALAGGLVGPLLYVSPTLGGTLGIKGFAAAILGGFGSIPGAIVGGLAIGILDSYAAAALPGLLRAGDVPGLHRDHHDPADRDLRREDGEPGMSRALRGVGAGRAASLLAVVAWLLPYGLDSYRIHVADTC